MVCGGSHLGYSPINTKTKQRIIQVRIQPSVISNGLEVSQTNNSNHNMTSFMGYLNNAMIKFLIYLTLYMCIVGQIMDIILK